MGSTPAARTINKKSGFEMEAKQNIKGEPLSGDSADTQGVKKILILDDDKWFSDLISELLESQNFKVKAVESGVDGLKEIMETDYDFILCDMMMPNLSGDMFYLAVQRARPNLCKRFIFMTGHKDNPKIAEFIKSVNGIVLWKPFDLYQLLEAIKTIEQTSK